MPVQNAYEDTMSWSPLLTVPDDVFSSLTSYNFDPAALERHRVRLARAIERLLN